MLLETLDRLRLWDRTVVVLLGDHGFHLGEHHGLWRKDTLFEEALHTPLIIAAPQVRGRGEAAAAEVELLDLYPTLVDLAGLPRVPGLDGTSLAPLLRDPAQRVRDRRALVPQGQGAAARGQRPHRPLSLHGVAGRQRGAVRPRHRSRRDPQPRPRSGRGARSRGAARPARGGAGHGPGPGGQVGVKPA